MNRPCDNCGRILTVPDIPLPENYTQKCTVCGHNNSVSDHYPDSQKELNDWDTLDNSSSGLFLHMPKSAGDTSTSPKSLALELEQKLRDLETRLRAEWKETTAKETAPPSAFQREIRKHVRENTVLIGTQQSGLVRVCEPLLKKAGFQVQTTGNLEATLEAVVQKPFHVLVLDQGFLKSGVTGKQILKYIKRTPLSVRRCQTVVLITPGIPTGESQVFFQWAIDFNIHTKDLSKLDEYLSEISHLKEELVGPYLV